MTGTSPRVEAELGTRLECNGECYDSRVVHISTAVMASSSIGWNKGTKNERQVFLLFKHEYFAWLICCRAKHNLGSSRYSVIAGLLRGDGIEPGPETKKLKGRSYALFPVSLWRRETNLGEWIKLSEGDFNKFEYFFQWKTIGKPLKKK